VNLQQRFNTLYESLTLSALDQLGAVYHPSVRFADPVAEHEGLPALDAYMRRLVAGCNYCHFRIRQQQFGDDWGWVNWTMTFASPRLNRSREIAVEGSSMLRISDDRICYQRDYYDMGAMIYEQLPLIGPIIRFIRRRLSR
jgi:hypothetical protein